MGGTTGGFGATTGGFGTSTLGGTTGGFGATTGGFGATTTQPSAFGQTPSAFGTGALTQTPSFATGFGSGSKPAVSFGGQTAGFGGTTANTGFGGGFGTTTTGFGQTPGTSSFGGGFGAGMTGQPTTGGFGGSSFNTTGFGGTPAATGGFNMMAQQPNQMMGGGMSGFMSQQPNQQQAVSQLSELQQKMDYLNRKKDELEIHLKDDKLALQQSQLQQSTAASSRLMIADSPYRGPTSMISYRHTPRSTAKITPRGYISTPTDRGNAALVDKDDRPLSSSAIKVHLTKLTTSSSAADLGATTSFLRPENLLGRSAKKLVIGPGFNKPSVTPMPQLTSGHNGSSDMIASNTPQDTTTPIRSSWTQDTATPHLSDLLLPKANTTTNNGTATTTTHHDGTTHTNINTQSQNQSQQRTVQFSVGDQTGLTPLATRSPYDQSNLISGKSMTPVTG